MFKIFKRENKSNKKIEKSINQFDDLWNVNIDDIWKIDNKNNFVIAMDCWVCKKSDYGKNIDKLNDQERIFYTVQTLESEVNNGGFDQFFFNNGEISNDLYDSFLAIGAIKTAELCKKAVDAFETEFPTNLDEVREFLDVRTTDKVTEILAECDDEFYEYLEDLTELNYQFIMKNKSYFV